MHIGAEVLHTAIEKGVEVLREGAHCRQRQDADDDARDGQRAAQLPPRDVAKNLHEGKQNIAAEVIDRLTVA